MESMLFNDIILTCADWRYDFDFDIDNIKGKHGMSSRKEQTRSSDDYDFTMPAGVHIKDKTANMLKSHVFPSRKHAYIILTPLNPTFM